MSISRTARAVAIIRAGFVRPVSRHGIPDAETRLATALLRDGPPPRGRLTSYLRDRTRFFDYHLLWALEAGTQQVVLVGAGYDLRAQRFRSPGVRFFELDLPETQADKRQRLADLGLTDSGVTFAPIDLASGKLAHALRAAGHDADRPSLFLCEGLLLYLDPETVRALLRDLRANAAPRSRLAMSIEVGEPEARRQQLHTYLRAIGEPPRSQWSADDWHQLLEATRWELSEPGAAVHERESRRQLTLRPDVSAA